MDFDKAITYIENSFISKLILDKDITDISYNGESIFYVHNLKGREKSDIQISQEDARDFIRQIANLLEKQFSFQVPNLDVSLGKYRINAFHQSIGRYLGFPCITFSIRIASKENKIMTDNEFLTPIVEELLENLINSKISIVIGGLTGSGKTELQKYLIGKMSSNTRSIIIDNVLELDNARYLTESDVTFWQYDDKISNISIRMLVKNALRNNPDWLLVAEARGEEMEEVLNAAMTGHPIITTLHAFDIFSMPNRIARMVMMSNKNSNYEEILEDINYHFRFYIYLKNYVDDDGKSHRFISQIGNVDKKGKINLIYKKENNNHEYLPICKENIELFDQKKLSKDFIKYFIKGVKNV